jgi:hypothetical protein
MYGNWSTPDPDNYFVCIDAATGRALAQGDRGSSASTFDGGAVDPQPHHHRRGRRLADVQAAWVRDPDTEELRWRWFTTPRPGEPGSEMAGQ